LERPWSGEGSAGCGPTEKDVATALSLRGAVDMLLGIRDQSGDRPLTPRSPCGFCSLP